MEVQMKSILLSALTLLSAVPMSLGTAFTSSAPPLPDSISQNINSAGTGWKICTPQGGNAGGTSPASEACGGVGSNQPSAWSWNFGSTMQINVSTNATSNETQILFVYQGPGCDDCTTITMDKWIEPTADATVIANNELDMYQFDHTHLKKRMFGLQCNQQRGFMQWQIHNVGGGYWKNTGITDHCPLPTDSYTHIVYQGHWIIGDTGCDGMGCNYYDSLTINGKVYPLRVKMKAATLPGWRAICGSQDQIDLRASSGGTLTGGRNIQNSNVTCSNGNSASGSTADTASGP
jgi:hypothetical protein